MTRQEHMCGNMACGLYGAPTMTVGGCPGCGMTLIPFLTKEEHQKHLHVVWEKAERLKAAKQLVKEKHETPVA